MAKEQKVYMPLIGRWFSPNTYSENYLAIPELSGVYYFETVDGEILYVGSAKNLKSRYKNHELRRLLNRVYTRVLFNFWLTEDYKDKEIELIKLVRPKYNYQHNG